MKQKWKIDPDSPKNESGLIQVIRMGKSVRHKLVNNFVGILGKQMTSIQK